MKERVTTGSLQERIQTPGGRRIVMGRMLREKPFLGWVHDVRKPETRLSSPL
jgi:hypothetical protein